MAFLLDTNVIIWLFEGRAGLSQKVKDRLLTGDEIGFISVLSGWEYEDKRKKRPAEYRLPFAEIIAEVPHIPLNLEFDVYRYAERLPLIHRDPFDRMLVAQAIHHDLEFIASDEAIHRYPVRIFW
ncbi:MAG: type II toxin-antitoxin system VapC family toxin [Sphingomonadaceae bacterium]|nr:type II toxin-antitoxin system VapC family toxin [Sphingomonadaceae bacterium]